MLTKAVLGPQLLPDADKTTVPLPVPLAPLVTVNHPAPSATIPLQEGDAVTSTLTLPPPIGIVGEDGGIEVHSGPKAVKQSLIAIAWLVISSLEN